MTKSIVIVGTLDTKAEEMGLVKRHVEQRGHKTVVVDIGMGGEPLLVADITCDEVARAGGGSIEEIRRSTDRHKINRIILEGAVNKVKELYVIGKLDGIISIGGATGTFIGTSVMKALPFGVPKFMVSSNAAQRGFASRYFGTKDITMMHTVVDIAGLSDALKMLLIQAASAICAMVESADLMAPALAPQRPPVAVTELGVSAKTIQYIRQLLEQRGYQVSVFTATGIGDTAMEEMVEQGLFQAVIDLSPGGLIDALCDGSRAASPQRLEAAGRRGIPQVIAPGGLDFISPPRSKYKPEYKERKSYQIDELRVLLRSNVEELTAVARTIADKVNEAKGPVKFLIPLRGWSSFDGEGRPLDDPQANRAFVAELRRHLGQDIEIREIDAWIEDPDFALALVTALDEMMRNHHELK